MKLDKGQKKNIFSKAKKWLKQNIGFLILSHLPWQLCDFGFSGKIVIEATDFCNLRCPLCSNANLRRKKGFLSLENFKKIVDDIPGLKSIVLHFAGEPLLNKEIFKMVKYAESKSIKTIVSTNTVLLGKYQEEALDSGLSSIIVCLDGATKETHEKYRVGSNFESIKRNIKEFCQEKKKRNLKKPWVTLQFLVTKQSQQEIPAIIALAKDLGVDCLNLKTLSLSSHINLAKRIILAKQLLPSQEFSRYIFKDDKPVLKYKPKLCHWLRQSVILWNGDVICCCYDYEGELVVGNIFKDGGFKKIWKSEKYKKYRKKIIKKEFSLCQNCNLSNQYGKTIYFTDFKQL